jgi:hypothetical protein
MKYVGLVATWQDAPPSTLNELLYMVLVSCRWRPSSLPALLHLPNLSWFQGRTVLDSPSLLRQTLHAQRYVAECNGWQSVMLVFRSRPAPLAQTECLLTTCTYVGFAAPLIVIQFVESDLTTWVLKDASLQKLLSLDTSSLGYSSDLALSRIENVVLSDLFRPCRIPKCFPSHVTSVVVVPSIT